MKSKIKWGACQKHLEDTFNQGGIVGGRLLEIIQVEDAYSEFINNNYHGYNVLTDSFLSFFMQTLEAAEHMRITQQHEPRPWYGPLLLSQAINFQTFRATENLLRKGYPLSSYSILRDLKDRAIVLGAIANGITTYQKAFGLIEAEAQEKEEAIKVLYNMKKRRTRDERFVLEYMLGQKSGIPNSYRQELQIWQELFHLEVHGGRQSYVAYGIDWLQGRAPLPILPKPIPISITMYLNRSNEIAWMLLRTLTLLQPAPKAFGEKWCNEWKILDESFMTMVDALEEIGKKIATSFKYLMKNKFNFTPDRTFYTEKT